MTVQEIRDEIMRRLYVSAYGLGGRLPLDLHALAAELGEPEASLDAARAGLEQSCLVRRSPSRWLIRPTFAGILSCEANDLVDQGIIERQNAVRFSLLTALARYGDRDCADWRRLCLEANVDAADATRNRHLLDTYGLLRNVATQAVAATDRGRDGAAYGAQRGTFHLDEYLRGIGYPTQGTQT